MPLDVFLGVALWELVEETSPVEASLPPVSVSVLEEVVLLVPELLVCFFFVGGGLDVGGLVVPEGSK
jgi:hypothetical protein